MAKIIYGWDGKPIGIVPAKGENPMLVFGYGPEGVTCKECIHLIRHKYHDKVYLKCELRPKLTHGKGTDHKASWPACGKYSREAGQ